MDNRNALIIIITLTSAFVLMSTLLIYSYRKRTIERIISEKINTTKGALTIDIKKRLVFVTEISIDDDEKINIHEKNGFKLSVLMRKIDSVSSNPKFIAFLKKMNSKKEIEFKEKALNSSIGLHEMIRIDKKRASYITITNYDEESNRVHIVFSTVDFGIESNGELVQKEKTYDERNIVKKLSAEIKEMKKPVIVRISAKDTYTNATDPILTPSNMVRIISFWMSKKRKVFISREYDIYFAIDVSEQGINPENIDAVIRKRFNSKMREYKLFSSFATSNFDSFAIKSVYTFNKSKQGILNTMTILRTRRTAESWIGEYNPNIKKERLLIEEAINQTVEKINKSIRTMSIYYDDTSVEGIIILNSSLQEEELRFVSLYSIALREKFTKKFITILRENTDKTLSPATTYANINWRIMRAVMDADEKLVYTPVVTHYSSEERITYKYSLFMETIQRSGKKIAILVKSSSKFYKKLINRGIVNRVLISNYTRIMAADDILMELEISKIEELSKARKIKVS